MEADEVSIREQNFHSQVREYTICFLLFAVLYIVSYFIITRYKRKADEQEDEDAIVNRISFMESCFSFFQFMFVCVDALCLFLLGIGRICWLEKVSGFSLFCPQGIRARILETLVMLILLALLILGIVWVASALIDNDAASMESLYDLWEFYLPYLYSCISLMGCLLLLLCTPVGLSRMFTVMGQLLVKPTILEDLDEQMYIITLEEEAIQRKLNGMLVLLVLQIQCLVCSVPSYEY
ncbi:hypothetical protein CIB84_000158 [Bambusicola thoracicus]|uniref:Uncharacterized protein n=1 Tax=Bambusicola thoracicus TaxID=9083 RepID=A0A2P4TIC0_BAMTH|nr:hypothetical protein CIB84_000158 [Bambusicola thoracicus]